MATISAVAHFSAWHHEKRLGFFKNEHLRESGQVHGEKKKERMVNERRGKLLIMWHGTYKRWITWLTTSSKSDMWAVM